MPGRIVVTEFVSLDGVMEAPGGEPDFKYPGWTFEFDRGEDGNQFKRDETMRADALLIGRRTYESFAGAWPQREGEVADKFNTMRKYVVSTTLTGPLEWENSTLLEGEMADAVAALKQEDGGDLHVIGSTELVRTLIAHGLVDELRLMIDPVVVGGAKRIFPDDGELRPLRLVEGQITGLGAILATYVPV